MAHSTVNLSYRREWLCSKILLFIQLSERVRKLTLHSLCLAEIYMRWPEARFEFQGLSQLEDRLVVTPSLIKRLRHHEICYCGHRIEFNSASAFANRFFKLSFLTQEMCIGVMRERGIWVQPQRRLILLLCTCPIPVVIHKVAGQADMGFRKIIVKFQGAPSCGHREWSNVRWSDVAIEYERPIGIRQCSISSCVRRVFFDGCLKQFDSVSFVRAVAQVQVEQAAKIIFVRFGINTLAMREVGLFLWSELQLDFIHNGLGHLVLQTERIAQITFVTLGPQMRVARTLN